MSHQYRKKPVVVEAFRVPMSGEPMRVAPPMWVYEALLMGVIEPAGGGVIRIRTLEGQMNANVGDWIIRGVKGELYPCKDEIFQATYERVEAGQ